MLAQLDRAAIRRRVRHRVRRKISGTAARPRLAVFRSVKHMYVQAIDDETGRTVAQASTQDPALRSGKGWNCEAATRVGQAMAGKLKEAGIQALVFDRGGFSYHGRIKALAEALRAEGLKF
jgi:large subunit ribosomal protein L18